MPERSFSHGASVGSCDTGCSNRQTRRMTMKNRIAAPTEKCQETQPSSTVLRPIWGMIEPMAYCTTSSRKISQWRILATTPYPEGSGRAIVFSLLEEPVRTGEIGDE